jgi:putative transposase
MNDLHPSTDIKITGRDLEPPCTRSRQTYGSPRVHAELRLGQGIRVGRTRVERLMRAHRIVGVHRRRRSGCTVRDPAEQPSVDLVERRFSADRPDALWVSDVTQHRTERGRVYCAVVLDACSRRVVGWSIADHLRTELVVDALEMACLRRRPAGSDTVFHTDHGSQYTSWAFGQRLRQAGCSGRWAPSVTALTVRVVVAVRRPDSCLRLTPRFGCPCC